MEYKFGDRIFREGDEVEVVGYGRGIVVSVQEAKKNKPIIMGDPTVWVYVKIGNDYTGYVPSSITIINSNNSSPVASTPAPRNNDGRTTCFWCNVPTQLRGGGAYNVCPHCGK